MPSWNEFPMRYKLMIIFAMMIGLLAKFIKFIVDHLVDTLMVLIYSIAMGFLFNSILIGIGSALSFMLGMKIIAEIAKSMRNP